MLAMSSVLVVRAIVLGLGLVAPCAWWPRYSVVAAGLSAIGHCSVSGLDSRRSVGAPTYQLKAGDLLKP